MSKNIRTRKHKRSDLSVWRIDYLALLEEKESNNPEKRSLRWKRWHEEYIDFINKMVPKEDHKKFHKNLMDVIYDRIWCKQNGIDYTDPSVKLAALKLCQERYSQSIPNDNIVKNNLEVSSFQFEKVKASGKKIMVVDDEESIREFMEETLSISGHQVITCESGDVALAEVKKELPDMVFLDLKMPGKDGIDVLKELIEIYPGLPVVMLTGYPTIETAKQAVTIGACDYVSKPLDVNLVMDMVKDVLDV